MHREVHAALRGPQPPPRAKFKVVENDCCQISFETRPGE
jgi:hypothetical protein